jgi:hypothetical protein
MGDRRGTFDCSRPALGRGWVVREMSVTERRCQAALAVLGGIPVTEVASRFGVGPADGAQVAGPV